MAHPTPGRRRASIVGRKPENVLIVPEQIRMLASALTEALSPAKREVYIFLFMPSAEGDVGFRVFRGDQPGALPRLAMPGALKCHTHLLPGPEDTAFTPPSETDLVGTIWDNLMDRDSTRYNVVFQPNGGLWWYRPQQELLKELLALQPDLMAQLDRDSAERVTPQEYVEEKARGAWVYDFPFTPKMLERVIALERLLSELQLGLRTGTASFVEEDSETGEEHETMNKAATLADYLAETSKAGFDVHYAGPRQEAAVPLTDKQMALAAQQSAADRGALSVDKLTDNPSLLLYLTDRLSDPDSLDEPDYL